MKWRVGCCIHMGLLEAVASPLVELGMAGTPIQVAEPGDKMSRVMLALALISLFATSACGERTDGVAYCQVGLSARERIHFDLDRMVVSGADSISQLIPVQGGRYTGFVEPIPLLVPARELMRGSGAVVWELEGYRFAAIASSPTSDWIVVEATPAYESEPDLVDASRRTTLVYSWQSGLIVFSTTMEFDGESFTTQNYVCGSEPLRLEPPALAHP